MSEVVRNCDIVRSSRHIMCTAHLTKQNLYYWYPGLHNQSACLVVALARLAAAVITVALPAIHICRFYLHLKSHMVLTLLAAMYSFPSPPPPSSLTVLPSVVSSTM